MSQMYSDDLAKMLEKSCFVWIAASMLASLGANTGYNVTIGVFSLLTVYIQHGRLNVIALALTAISVFVDILYIGFHAGTLVALGKEYLFAFLMTMLALGAKLSAGHTMLKIHPFVRSQMNILPSISMASLSERLSRGSQGTSGGFPSSSSSSTRKSRTSGIEGGSDKQRHKRSDRSERSLKGDKSDKERRSPGSRSSGSGSGTGVNQYISYHDHDDKPHPHHAGSLVMEDDVEIGDDGYNSIVHADVKPLLSK